MDAIHEWLERMRRGLREIEAGIAGSDAEDEAVERGDEEAVARALAEAHGVAYADATGLLQDLDVALAANVPHGFRDKQRVAPICRKPGEACVVVASDGAPHARRRLAKMLDADDVEWRITTASGMRRLLSAIDVGEVTRGLSEEAELQDARDDLLEHDLARQTQSVGVLESILIEAAAERASDIHLEHEPGGVSVRIRVDGDLRALKHYALSSSQLGPIVRVVKVRAAIDIAEQRRPQAGQFEMRVGGRHYFIRVQTQPTVLGENCVLRLLPQDPQLETIEQLGFSQAAEQSYRRLLRSPGGLVLLVGPTGSGKTTTLYAGLRVLAADRCRKVISIEDPVETVCPGVWQVQVNEETGFGFADAMRSFVRADPDAILLGEVRDEESAREAIRASQTGHLVLTSLHCNDAVDAVQRLRDLGMHPNSIATELVAVFAQRLARRICDACREEVEPDPAVVREVFPDGVPEGFRAFRGAGCERCRQTGGYGRIAVVECLMATPDLRRAIAADRLIDDLRELAADSGLVSLRDRAIELAGQGVIAFDALPRFLSLERLAPARRRGGAS